MFSRLALCVWIKFTGFLNWQVVVFGKVHDKIKCPGVNVMKSGVDDYAFDFCDNYWPDVRRVGETRVSCVALRTKSGHNPAEPLSPITWSKRFARFCNTLNKKLFMVQISINI